MASIKRTIQLKQSSYLSWSQYFIILEVNQGVCITLEFHLSNKYNLHNKNEVKVSQITEYDSHIPKSRVG